MSESNTTEDGGRALCKSLQLMKNSSLQVHRNWTNHATTKTTTTKASLRRLQVAHDDAMRIMLKRPRWTRASEMFVAAGVKTFKAVLRNLMHKFIRPGWWLRKWDHDVFIKYKIQNYATPVPAVETRVQLSIYKACVVLCLFFPCDFVCILLYFNLLYYLDLESVIKVWLKPLLYIIIRFFPRNFSGSDVRSWDRDVVCVQIESPLRQICNVLVLKLRQILFLHQGCY